MDLEQRIKKAIERANQNLIQKGEYIPTSDHHTQKEWHLRTTTGHSLEQYDTDLPQPTNKQATPKPTTWTLEQMILENTQEVLSKANEIQE